MSVDITPRDLFAGHAMKALLADRSQAASAADLAARAFALADAMMLARGSAPPAHQAAKPAPQRAK